MNILSSLYPSMFTNRSSHAAKGSQSLFAPDAFGSASTESTTNSSDVSSSSGKKFDFTAVLPSDLNKLQQDLSRSGKLSDMDSLNLSFLSGNHLKLLGVADRNPAQPQNLLQQLQQRIDYDKTNANAAPGQVERMQALLDKLTALQGSPKGVDIYA